MPSPFPGMDPYLEAPDIWPDFHDHLAAEISTHLNQTLPSHYYARLEMRPEVGIILEGEEARRRVVPDVAVVRSRQPLAQQAGTAVLEHARAEISPYLETSVPIEPLRHHFVEIRDGAQNHKLITLIEILSPSNKRPGVDRNAYQRKQRELLNSDASLIEIDLLRDGQRVLASPYLTDFIARINPPPAYLVLVSRAWQRTDTALGYQVFPCRLREWLPCIAVPLLPTEPEVVIDIQFIVNRAYDAGPYQRGAVDYGAPPNPPLEDEDADWAEQLLEGS